VDGLELAHACPRSPEARVGRAIRWLRENFARPTRVEQLAAQAAMSVSTFHRHFKAATAMAPLQYQKQLRLLEARRLLLAGGRGVAEAAFAVGYESPAQFSREYARLFGTPPVRDRVRPRHGA
jgi:transcriptional regulator GlxA family with amidase domain